MRGFAVSLTIGLFFVYVASRNIGMGLRPPICSKNWKYMLVGLQTRPFSSRIGECSRTIEAEIYAPVTRNYM
jgi:hypothetical protein